MPLHKITTFLQYPVLPCSPNVPTTRDEKDIISREGRQYKEVDLPQRQYL